MTCGETRIHRDMLGRLFPVERLTGDEFATLLELYDSFFPETKTQGLPPYDRDARVQWIRRLLDTGENFVVPRARDGRLIGHAALIPSYAMNDAEYLIFVGRPYRKKGVGTELTRAALQKAQELGLRSVWLTVSAANFRAIMLFKKFGFQFCGMDEWERKMAVEV